MGEFIFSNEVDISIDLWLENKLPGYYQILDS
jgi:hypothetical protein